MKFKSDLPYPEIKVENKNIEYAKILLNNYSGNISELTAIMTYSYQSFITEPDISHAIEEISEVEMHHLKILATLIKQLGLYPNYKYSPCVNNTFYYWDSTLVDYQTNPKQIILNNIKAEEEAINSYTKSIELINDKNVQENLKRIIEDEKIHICIFRELLNKH